MICVKCDSTEFRLKPDARVEQEFRGRKLWVVSPVMECVKCGWQALGEGQLDELGRRTADAYRQAHSLLTSQEIRARRDALGMSQREFAEFLDVGEASVKRWETWHVQDKIYDERIRQRCARTASGVEGEWVLVGAVSFYRGSWTILEAWTPRGLPIDENQWYPSTGRHGKVRKPASHRDYGTTLLIAA